MDAVSVDVAAGWSPASPAQARERARLFLDSLTRPLTRTAEESVILVVSELVTNALLHGGGACTLGLTAHPDAIDVAVRDHSARAPRMRTPDLHGGTGGFGWPLVNRLARTTAVTLQTDGGKTVSALMDR